MSIFKKIKLEIKRWLKIKKLDELYALKTISEVQLNKNIFIEFNSSETPTVSIIIPFYNQINYTVNCLHYLNKHLTNKYPYEIILIDDNSKEPYDLSTIKGFKLIKNNENQGFLKNINIGIKAALGEYIYILNNDIEVQAGFLDELFFVFENFANVGAVGSKLLNANGTLQEAGAVFLKNGEIHQIFNKKKTYYPEVNYIKQVDYCSGCSLLFKKQTDDGELNLFDEQFAPAYFEETDFCFQLKFLQQKNIYYTPFSEVIHFDGVTYNATKSDNKQTQKANIFKNNKLKFYAKWQTQINSIQASTIPARVEEIYGNKSIVFFVGIIPAHDKDSGSNRLKEIIQAYIKLGYHITMVKNKSFIEESAYVEYYQRLGVNVFYEHNFKITVKKYLVKQNNTTKLAWFYNADVFDEYFSVAKSCLPNAKFIFDMVDIHHLRLQRALDLEPNNKRFKKQYARYKQIESNAAQVAHYVITISDFEKEYMQQFCSADKIITISNIHYIKTSLQKTLPFEQRKDILFIGSVHEPNIDAIYFLYKDIMPIVWKTLPYVKVNIIGNVNNLITDIQHPNFNFVGYVPDIEPYFFSNKLMIAPLRYGAGVKGKIGQAFEYYLPVVTTSIGAEGMTLENNANALIYNSAVDLANAIIELYSNKITWLTLQQNSENSLAPFSKDKLVKQLLKIY
jgi:O-antigen biosynthesis protein